MSPRLEKKSFFLGGGGCPKPFRENISSFQSKGEGCSFPQEKKDTLPLAKQNAPEDALKQGGSYPGVLGGGLGGFGGKKKKAAFLVEVDGKLFWTQKTRLSGGKWPLLRAGMEKREYFNKNPENISENRCAKRVSQLRNEKGKRRDRN